ncbi:hypothetical protein [Paracoccus hibiscisoli]|uniref:Uncharacterized protein n=1 Tax=Paracoccus hibiscisoli TaxID=2023261 RepID=A0A4U0Q6N5_9RHOB|nr:hypothetical protein [Paracoccus hibiscisoli]TJZ76871.1 hypothetical protein FA740_19300 [Paracoccus hibiscisoli]
MSVCWTRKRTFEPDQGDWFVLINEVIVGRVMRDDQQTSRANRDQWSRSVINMLARNGLVAEALEKVRELATDDWGHNPHGWPVNQ